MRLFHEGVGGSGAGRTKGWSEEGWRERRGWSKGRLVGMTTTVTVRPRRSNWCVRSRSGMMWPEAG